MKILHIIGLALGGAGQHILSLATGCNRERFETTVAMADGSPMQAQFEREGVRVLPLVMGHYGGVRKNVTAFRQLRDILLGEQYDVIQTHTSMAGALGRIAARKYTTAPTVHMLHTFAGHPYRSKLSRIAAAVVERRLDRLTDWYIAGSRAMVERGVTDRIFTADKVELISNGIDLAPFRSALATGAKNGSGNDGTRGEVTIGFLGRLEKQKGLPYLVQAAALVRKQHPRVRFLVAGEGSMLAPMQQLADRLKVNDVVEFIGWQNDTPGFLQRIDIMAMPSLWEAFGLSAAEAMAMEKPVVASRTQGLPEVVEDGRTGLLVPPADPQALASALSELVADPERRRLMGARGRERAEAFFSLDRMVSLHEDFYERIVPAPARREFVETTPISQELVETAHSGKKVFHRANASSRKDAQSPVGSNNQQERVVR